MLRARTATIRQQGGDDDEWNDEHQPPGPAHGFDLYS